MGIMTSPELIAKKEEKGHKRGASYESGSHEGGYSVSVSSNGRVEVDDDLYINGVGGGHLPGWGAGWSVQANTNRGLRRDGRVESVQLNDVGRLLK